jgi:hypothetical protein
MADQELELVKPVAPVETITWAVQRVAVDVQNAALVAEVVLVAQAETHVPRFQVWTLDRELFQI